MTKFNEESYLSIGVYAGSFGPLDKIDLSFLNLRFDTIDSNSFKEFLESKRHKTFSDNEDTWEEFKETWHSAQLFVLHPIDLRKKFDEEIYYDIQNIFLVMFPSDFRLYATVMYQLFDHKYLYANGTITWPFNPSGKDLYDNFLFFDESNIVELNEFLALYFQRRDQLTFLEITMAAYINSFFEHYQHMAYVSLCISLESTTNGTTELLYRIRRNCAVLNSDTKEKGQRIFNNVKLLYDLRSKIVHGSKVNWKKLSAYYPKLRALTSRTIIELISLNIVSVDELNEKLTQTGFGQKATLSNHYKKYNLDINTLMEINRPMK